MTPSTLSDRTPPMIQGEPDRCVPVLPFGFQGSPYGLNAAQKMPLLLQALNDLTEWHTRRSQPYAEMRHRLFRPETPQRLIEVPWLPVRVFKTQTLLSVEPREVVKTLTSSGTSGQTVSRIHLDRETAWRQTKALSHIMTHFLGKQRWPMVIVDSPDLLKDRQQFNARAAGILGFSVFGRQHLYALDEGLSLRVDALRHFLQVHSGTPILLFGFTALVWQHLLQASLGLTPPLNLGAGSTLIHGGGWKRLQDQQVSRQTYDQALQTRLGIDRVINYYGMVEQVGSIFMSCEQGYLHAPVHADVLIRDPLTLEPVAHGQAGVIQVLSALPLSYPGHSLLTEDLGVVHGEDHCPCGRHGTYFSVLGRLPQVELRGCSDTRMVSP